MRVADVPVDTAQVTLSDVAMLDGTIVEQYADTMIYEYADDDMRSHVIKIGELRNILNKKGVNWGRISLSGDHCRITKSNEQESASAEMLDSRNRSKSSHNMGHNPAINDPKPIVGMKEPGDWAIDLMKTNTLRGLVAEYLSIDFHGESPDAVWVYFSTGSGSISVDDDSILDLDIQLHDFEIIPQATPRSHRIPMRINVYQNEQLIRSGRIVVETKIRKKVYIAQRYIGRNEATRPTDFRIETQLEKPNPVPLWSTDDSIIGYETRGRIISGQVLRVGDLVKPTVVKRNSEVLVRAKAGSIIVRMRAVAMEAGRTGEIIRLRHIGSRTELFARIEENGNLVVVDIDTRPVTGEQK